MSDKLARVSVRLLEKEYQVACPPEERAQLLESAELLNQKMLEIRESGKIVGLDRIAVMAALNLADELLKERQTGQTIASEASDRLKDMRQRVESALGQSRQLEL